MKTSQEIAEEMAGKVSSCYTTLSIPITKGVAHVIHLAQLIEVARAAMEVEKLTPLTKFKITEKDVELAAALDALKATGKAEWL